MSPSTDLMDGVGPLCGLLLEAVKDLCEAEAASILEIDQRGDLLFRFVDGGAGERLSGTTLPAGEGVAGRVLRSGQPEIVGSLGSSSQKVATQFGYETHTMIVAPLVDRMGRLMGVVEAVNASMGAFDRRHLDALVRLATPIADALRAVEELGSSSTALTTFYRALMDVMRERGAGLKDLNEELVESRRAFELDRARRYSDQKMTGLARMACGVAHEVNNPLSVAQSNLNTMGEIVRELTRDLGGQPLPDLVVENLGELGDITKEIRDGLARIARVTDRLMTFGDMDLDRVDEVDVGEELNRVAELFRAHVAMAGHVAIVVDVTEPVRPILSNRHHIRQALVEIVDNAVRAGGQVDDGEVSLRCFSDVDTLHLTVTDNGPGIPAALQGQVFDPFFTTKSEWRATGLGLTAAYGTVRALGGTIALDSAPGHGTSVTVSLPTETRTVARTGRASRSGRYYEDLA